MSHVDPHLVPQAHGVGHTPLRRVNVDLLTGTQAEPLASHVEGAVGGDVGADGWVVDDWSVGSSGGASKSWALLP